MNSQRIRLDLIDVGERLRSIDNAYVQMIAASMADRGQLTPIEVRPSTEAAGRFKLMAGAHRRAAAFLLGWPEIDATVREADDLAAELIEIDENLMRRELSELDRATFLARRKELHEQLHPHTKHGGKRRGDQADKFGHLIGAFSAEVAERLNLSERSVRRAVARFTRIAPDVRAKIAGTWLADHATQLDALARLDGETQRKVVGLLTAALSPEPNVAAALATLLNRRKPAPDPDADTLRRLSEAWRKATQKAREQHLRDLIDMGLVLPRPARGAKK